MWHAGQMLPVQQAEVLVILLLEINALVLLLNYFKTELKKDSELGPHSAFEGAPCRLPEV